MLEGWGLALEVKSGGLTSIIVDFLRPLPDQSSALCPRRDY